MCTHHSHGHNEGFVKFVHEFSSALKKAVNAYSSLYDMDGLEKSCLELKETCHDSLISTFHALSEIRQVMEGKPFTRFQDLELGEKQVTCDGDNSFIYTWGLI